MTVEHLPRPARQRGATLMIALVMLAVILLLGTASASLLVLDEHAARSHRAHAQALLAAQAALDDACEEIRRGARVLPAAFPRDIGCHADAEGRILCLGEAEHAAWKPAQLSGAAPGAAGYGEWTGRRAPALEGGPPAPRYLIELLAASKAKTTETTKAADGDAEAGRLYRISALGFGAGGAQAALQSIVRQRADAAGRMQCHTLGWRALSLNREEPR
jgi:type IV pilus assembly protein PilX